MHRKPLTFCAMLVLLSAPLFGQNKEPASKPPVPLTNRSLDLLIRQLNDPLSASDKETRDLATAAIHAIEVTTR
jgi:hypothetical protein